MPRLVYFASFFKLEIVFTIAAPFLISCLLDVYWIQRLRIQLLQDATRRWRSPKATKQTRTRRCKTFKCCKMLLEDEDDETRPFWLQVKYYPRPLTRDHCARLVSSNRECFAHCKHISYFFNKYSLSLYVYTRGLLGCLLGFCPPQGFGHWAKTLRMVILPLISFSFCNFPNLKKEKGSVVIHDVWLRTGAPLLSKVRVLTTLTHLGFSSTVLRITMNLGEGNHQL